MVDDTPPEQKTRNLGKVMIILAWIIIFAGLIWFFGILETNKFNPNQNVNTKINSDGQKEVVLESGAYGHYVASGKINNYEVTFLVDTGASYVSIPEQLANKIGLKKGAQHRVSTANGDITVYGTNLDKISIGDIELNDVRADINPYMLSLIHI